MQFQTWASCRFPPAQPQQLAIQATAFHAQLITLVRHFNYTTFAAMAWQGVEELDPVDPASFYLEQPQQVELADDVLLVEDTHLPVHSAVLSMKSKVFLEAYLIQREARGSRKRPRANTEGWNPFGQSTSLVEAAVFLRLLYRSQEWDTILGHGSVRPLLPALAKMADKFDVPWLLDSVQRRLGDIVDSGVKFRMDAPTLQDVVSYLHLAGPPLRLSELRDKCIAAIVDHVISCRSSDDRSGGFMDAAVLAGAEPGVTASVFGALLCAVQASPKSVQDEIRANAPSNLRCEAWSQLSGRCDKHVWVVEGLDDAVAAGQALKSKTFEMAGQAWALELYVHTPSASDADGDEDQDEAPDELRLELLWLPRGRRDSGRPVGARATLVKWLQEEDAVTTTVSRPEVFYAPRGARRGSGGGAAPSASGASSVGGGGAAGAAVDGNYVRAAVFNLGLASYALDHGAVYGLAHLGELKVYFEMAY